MSNYNKNFIEIKLSSDTVYVYSVRKLLQKAIDKNINLFFGTLLDVGCGEMPYREYILDKNINVKRYIGMDINNNKYHHTVKPDLFWDGKKIDIENEKIDTIIATEFFEHISNIDSVLMEMNRILSKKGILFFTVPFIWPLHETPNDENRFTPYSLEKIFKKAGFREIKISPLGGYNASLAQMLCIWINNYRSEHFSRFRMFLFKKIEKYFLYPIIEKLLNVDNKLNNNSYGENAMSTGFYGYARK